MKWRQSVKVIETVHRLLQVVVILFALALFWFSPLWSQTQMVYAQSGGATVSTPVPVSQVPTETNHLADTVTWALVASFVMQYLKKANWFSFLTPETTSRVKTQVGFIVALATAAGVHFGITGSFIDGHGLSLSITGVSWSVCKDIAVQWAAQQGWYTALVKESLPAPLTPLVTTSV